MNIISDELGFVLHDRSTRGAELTSEEKEQLVAWYAERDAVEALWLDPCNKSGSPDQANLQSQIDIDTVLQELKIVTQQIQQISSENIEIKQEIVVLKEQLITPVST